MKLVPLSNHPDEQHLCDPCLYDDGRIVDADVLTEDHIEGVGPIVGGLCCQHAEVLDQSTLNEK